MTSRAVWVRVALAILSAGTLLASPACTPKAKPPLDLVFGSSWPAGVLAPELHRFESENPGIRVRLEPVQSADGNDPVDTAIASGEVPDLCAIASGDMPRLLAAGSLSDWSAGVADQRDSLVGWELCTVGDAVYGMPWMLAPHALFWNKALFARARLDTTRAPETRDELSRAAAAVQRLGHGVHGYGVCANDRERLFERFMPFAWGDSGEILSAGLDSARFDSPANREALEFYLSLRRSGIIATAEALDREFAQGRLGMLVSGPWLLAPGAQGVRGVRSGIALVPRPALDRGFHASIAGGEVLVSFQSSRHKAEALRLARFLVRPDVATRLAAAVAHRVPATRAVDSLGFFVAHPGPRTLVLQLATACYPPRHPRWTEMRAAIEDEIEQAMFDRKPASQAIADANARIVELVGGR